MKKLWFSRHAKSSWDFPELTDINRPLLDIGIDRTLRIADFLKQYEETPGLILSSPAVRAFETAKLLAHGTDYPVQTIQVESDLYFGMEDDYWSIIFQLDNDIHSALIVGHNPTITAMVNYFLEEKIDYLPTSGFVAFSFNTSKWEEITRVSCKTDHVLFPKKI